jgi:hypothetical protein
MDLEVSETPNLLRSSAECVTQDIAALLAEREALEAKAKPILDEIAAINKRIRARRSQRAAIRREKMALESAHKKSERQKHKELKRQEKIASQRAELLKELESRRDARLFPRARQCSTYDLAYLNNEVCHRFRVPPIISLWRCEKQGRFKRMGLHFCAKHRPEIYSEPVWDPKWMDPSHIIPYLTADEEEDDHDQELP